MRWDQSSLRGPCLCGHFGDTLEPVVRESHPLRKATIVPANLQLHCAHLTQVGCQVFLPAEAPWERSSGAGASGA